MEIKGKKFRCTLNVFRQIFHLLIFLLFIVSTVLITDSVSIDNSISNSTEISTNECLPGQIRKNVVFLKTHKCASSTVQNILLRFGFKNKLKFVLPIKGNYLGHPSLFSHKLVPPGTYNIIAHHTRLNYPEMMLVTPSDTLYVTILRDPVSLFESMYDYYKMEERYKFKFKWFDQENLTKMPDFSRQITDRIGTNQMFFDLGFNLPRPKSDNYTSHIEYLDSIFDLVMIEEHMDESLILLKNLLCCPIDDVVAFRVNARFEKEHVGRLATERIRKLNQADVQLYEFFLKKFKQQIAKSDTIHEEVEKLRRRRKTWFDECVNSEKFQQNLTSRKVTRTSKVVQFTSKKSNLTCEILTSTELALTKFIREQQLKLYPNSVYTSIIKQRKSMLASNLLKRRQKSSTSRYFNL